MLYFEKITTLVYNCMFESDDIGSGSSDFPVSYLLTVNSPIKL